MNDTGEHPNAVQRVLQERARLVARLPSQELTEDTIEVLVVGLAAERYGLETALVSEIQHLGQVAPVPGLRSLWVGLVNIRSQLVPLLDLRAALGLAPLASGDAGRATAADLRKGPTGSQSHEKGYLDGQIVLVEAGGVRAGLLVDEVLKVQRLPRAAVGACLGAALSPRRKVTQGLTPGLLTVLDLQALLTDPALVVDDQVM